MAVNSLGYAPPPPRPNYAREIAWGIVTIAVTAIVFGIGGAIIGTALGYFAPSYYRGVFRNSDPAFNPVAVGFGLGLSQGAMLGVAAGVLLAFILAWRHVRLSRVG